MYGGIIKQFIPSPLFDNWFVGKDVNKELIICSPYIKLDSVVRLFDSLGIGQCNPKGLVIKIYTSGDILTYLKKSSDSSIFDYLSKIPKLHIHLLMNIHMKAYCIDKSELLIGSGNWTPSGLYSRGNIEAAIATTEHDDLESFLKYCEEMNEYCTLLDSEYAIKQFYNELVLVENDNQMKLKGVLDLEEGITTESFTYKIKSYRIGKRVRIPKIKYDGVPSSFDDLRKIVYIDEVLSENPITPEVAYFLGGLAINGFKTTNISGQKKMLVNYRYNTSRQLMESLSNEVINHINAVIDIFDILGYIPRIDSVDNYTRKLFGNNKCGFIIAFNYDKLFNEDTLEKIFQTINESSEEIKIAFLVGAFDSRGTPDMTAKLITMDSESIEMGNSFNNIMESIGLKPTPINVSRERDKPGQAPRKPQIRLRLNDYFTHIGILSPGKAEKVSKNLGKAVKIDNSILPNIRKL